MIEDDCYFLGVHMRLSTRCKILFTLGLFANYFSLKSLSLSLKSHMNVLCALKLTELWNSSLFFDLNYKHIMGASLLALAKSIYYICATLVPYVQRLPRDKPADPNSVSFPHSYLTLFVSKVVQLTKLFYPQNLKNFG